MVRSERSVALVGAKDGRIRTSDTLLKGQKVRRAPSNLLVPSSYHPSEQGFGNIVRLFFNTSKSQLVYSIVQGYIAHA